MVKRDKRYIEVYIIKAIKEISNADLYENALKTREYAKEHFEINKIQEKLINDFNSIIK